MHQQNGGTRETRKLRRVDVAMVVGQAMDRQDPRTASGRYRFEVRSGTRLVHLPLRMEDGKVTVKSLAAWDIKSIG
jgi:hypothetical protein